MSNSTRYLSIFYLYIFLFNYVSSTCTSTSSLQLVRPSLSDRSLLEVNEEALSHIELIEDNLHVIGVIGPYHTGKSFLLNQLHGQNDGFCVGDTIDPQTMGIWAWKEPMTVNGKSILLLDCEGFFGLGASENYDAKLFSITTLLSSYLIFNTIKIIDQASAEYINLLAQRTQLFQLRTALQADEKDFSSAKNSFIDFPDFLWLVRDFYQDLNGKTPQDWLEQYLSGKRSDNSPKNIVENLFSSINCKTLPIPHKSLAALKDLSKTSADGLAEDFKHDMKQLKTDIFSSIKPKKVFDEPISGPKFAWLIRSLVNASNTNSFPQVASIWDLFVNTSHSQLSEYCADQYSNTLFLVAQIPMPRREWNKLVEQLTAKYVKIYENYLKDMNIKEKNNKVLLAHLSDVSTKHLQLTKDRFKQHMISIKDAQFDKAVHLLKTINLPITSAVLARKANEVLKFVRAEFTKEMTTYDSKEEIAEIEAMKSTLEAKVQGQYKITDNANNELIKTLLSNAMEEAIEQYKAVKYDVPASRSALASYHQKLLNEAVHTFDTKTKSFSEENLYKEYLQNLKDRVQAEFNKIEMHNMEVIEREKNDLLKRLNEEVLQDQISLESKIPYLIEELEVLIAEKSVKIKQKYENAIKKFEYKDTFDNGAIALQESLDAMSKQVLSRNDREYQAIFFKPLHKAAAAVRKEAPSYSLYESLVRRIRFLVSYYLQRNESAEGRNVSEATLKRLVDGWIEQEFSTILETKWKIFPLTNILSFFVNLFNSSMSAVPVDN